AIAESPHDLGRPEHVAEGRSRLARTLMPIPLRLLRWPPSSRCREPDEARLRQLTSSRRSSETDMRHFQRWPPPRLSDMLHDSSRAPPKLKFAVPSTSHLVLSIVASAPSHELPGYL